MRLESRTTILIAVLRHVLMTYSIVTAYTFNKDKHLLWVLNTPSDTNGILVDLHRPDGQELLAPAQTELQPILYNTNSV